MHMHNDGKGASHLDDLDELGVVVMAVEEWLLSEYHAREHAPKRPHVKRVVVILQVHQPATRSVSSDSVFTSRVNVNGGLEFVRR